MDAEGLNNGIGCMPMKPCDGNEVNGVHSEEDVDWIDELKKNELTRAP